MNKTTKYILSFLGIVVLVTLLFWGTNEWVESKIRSQLEAKSTEGMLHYGTLSVNLFSNRGTIDSLTWTSVQNNDTTLTVTCDKLIAEDLSWTSWLFRDQIILREVTVNSPEVVILDHKKDSTDHKSQDNQFSLPQNFRIKALHIQKGSFSGFDSLHQQPRYFGKIDHLEIKNVRPAPDSLHSLLPIELEAYTLNSDSLYYQIDKLRYMTVSSLNIHKKDITIDSLTIKSNYNQQEFQKHIPYEKSWVDLLIPQIKVNDFSWKDQDSILLRSSFIHVIAPSLHLAKDKTLPDYPYHKPLYSRMIRELPVTVEVDSIRVSDGTIVYDHYTRSTYSPGKVYIDELNGTIQTVTNAGLTRTDFPKTHVNANALLMKESRASIDWNFYINDIRDEFTISGTLSKITQEGINYFVRPALDMQAEGYIDDVAFNFAGNVDKANGDFRIRYDDFHLYFLKKQGRNKQFFKSAFVNLLIHNTMKKPVEKKDVTIQRPKTKSFWAYLWNMVQKGMRETMI